MSPRKRKTPLVAAVESQLKPREVPKTPKIFMGVDPGEYGAVAFYIPVQEGVSRSELHLVDLKIARGQKGKSAAHATIPELAAAIRTTIDIIGHPALAVVETPHSLPSDGHVGAFTFGKACGMVEGLLHGMGIAQIPVVPAVWKSLLGLSSVKSRSIAKAQELFLETDIGGEGHILFESPMRHADGRAEAALLAYLGAHRFGGFKIDVV